MDFGPAILAIIAKLDPVMLVMILLIGGCGYYHIVWRREDREDKSKLLDAFNKNSEALSSLKNVISAATGKPL